MTATSSPQRRVATRERVERLGAVAVGLGGALVDAALVAKGDWSAITERARRVTDAVAEARARQGAKT